MIYVLILIVYFDFHFNFISKNKFDYLLIKFCSIFSYPSIIQIILFIMRELLIASRHRFDRTIKAKQQQPPSQPTGRIYRNSNTCSRII